MQECLDGFELDGTRWAWGTPLDAARRQLAAQLCESGPGFVVARCASAYGFAASTVLLQAPADDRPVLRVEWTLAPEGGDAAPDPQRWLQPLQARLGRCTSSMHPDLSPYDDPAWGNRLYAAWQTPSHSLTLSVYGGLRNMPHGVDAGCIALQWTDETAAAAPFIDAWRARNAELALAAGSIAELRRFVLDTEQSFCAWPQRARPGKPLSPAARERRQRGLCLRHPGLLETPAAVAAQLDPRSIALWRSQAAPLWCASNLCDSVAFAAGDAVEVLWAETLPAKGSGAQRLIVGGWTALAYARAREIAEAAAYAQRLPGVRLRHSQDYDC